MDKDREMHPKLKWILDKIDRYLLFRPPQEDDLDKYLRNGQKLKGIDYYYGNVGLWNLGTNCYMNCVMQALRLNNRLCQHAIMNKWSTPFWWSMAQLFAKMKYSPVNIMNAQEFYYMAIPATFKINEQQDSSEFLTCLLLVLEWTENFSGDESFIPMALKFAPSTPEQDEYGRSILNRRVRRYIPRRQLSTGCLYFLNTPVTTVFEETSINTMFRGQYTTRIKCKACGNVTSNAEKFLELQLGVPENRGSYSVQQLIDNFFKPCVLDDDNKYFCNECQYFVEGRITTTIDIYPEYLILGIKNFRTNLEETPDEKPINRFINNEEIKLPTAFFRRSYKYQQYAAIIHKGINTESGHYFTIGKNKKHWFIYDDDLVIGITTNGISNLQENCVPYIIFYKRSDVKDPTEPEFDNLPTYIREILYYSLE